MATFQYRAKEGTGTTIDGVIEAETSEEALEKISRLGYLPVKIVEAQTAHKSQSEVSPRLKIQLFSEGIKSRDITVFGQQLASLLRSGVPILKAISIIAEPVQNIRFKSMLEDFQGEIKNGKSLSSALEKYPKLFSPLYLALVSAGESAGNLDQTLARVTEHRQKQEEILSHIRSAMVYPALMAFTGAGTIIFMLTFVMPRLLSIFSNLGGDLPLPTRIVISVSNGLRYQWGWGLVLLVAGFLFAIQARKGKAPKTVYSALSLKMPVFGALVLKSEIARFARTVELLLKSGISILKAIEVATPVLSNEILKKELIRCLQDLKEGGSFGKSLRKSKLFPFFMTNLIVIGEESGKLDEALSEVAAFYERETNEAIRAMTSLIEPLMILVMGLVVGFIVIAMLLPIFEINMAVK